VSFLLAELAGVYYPARFLAQIAAVVAYLLNRQAMAEPFVCNYLPHIALAFALVAWVDFEYFGNYLPGMEPAPVAGQNLADNFEG
jgi:hypothetical protein